jgi:hypothetical protein
MTRRWIIGAILAAVAAAVLAVCVPSYTTRRNGNICVNNLRQLDAAAMSHCLEQKLPFDQAISPEDVFNYMKAPVSCPSGNKPYGPFDVLHGPRCPNSEAHNRIFVTGGCRGERAAVWAAALSYAAAKGLTWSDTVDPKNMDVAFYCGKCTGTCPLDTNGYPPFVLAKGPLCPFAPDHNTARVRPWRNEEWFTEDGLAKTNLPLSRIDTNSWFDWSQQRMR